MKKLVLLGAIAALGLTACKKDHTCTCNYGEGDAAYEVATTANSKKSVAKAFCEDEGYEIVSVKVDGEELDLSDAEDNDNPCTLD